MVRSILIVCLLFSNLSFADVLFEGYSKVTSGGVHIGYIITRYEFDQKKKQFIATTFLRTNQLGGDLTESLKAFSTPDFKPLSYNYTTLSGKKVKTIDAKFEKGKMFATIKDGQKVERVAKEMPKGTFLSSVLAYVMLNSKDGFKAGTKYNYDAVAEEDAAVNKGIAIVKNPEDYNGIKVSKVLNEFKNGKFISYVTDHAEVIATKSPVEGIGTELVAQPSQATNGLPVPAAVLKQLFGEVPTGQKNSVSKNAHEETPDKKQGIPGGKGVQLKGGGAPAPAPTSAKPLEKETK